MCLAPVLTPRSFADTGRIQLEHLAPGQTGAEPSSMLTHTLDLIISAPTPTPHPPTTAEKK